MVLKGAIKSSCSRELSSRVMKPQISPLGLFRIFFHLHHLPNLSVYHACGYVMDGEDKLMQTLANFTLWVACGPGWAELMANKAHTRVMIMARVPGQIVWWFSSLSTLWFGANWVILLLMTHACGCPCPTYSHYG